MANHPKPSAKNEQGEYAAFSELLKTVLRVPNSRIKALEAEKRKSKRASASRVSGDTSKLR